MTTNAISGIKIVKKSLFQEIKKIVYFTGKKFISGNKKNCVFFACFFSSPSLTLFQIDLGHFFLFHRPH